MSREHYVCTLQNFLETPEEIKRDFFPKPVTETEDVLLRIRLYQGSEVVASNLKEETWDTYQRTGFFFLCKDFFHLTFNTHPHIPPRKEGETLEVENLSYSALAAMYKVREVFTLQELKQETHWKLDANLENSLAISLQNLHRIGLLQRIETMDRPLFYTIITSKLKEYVLKYDKIYR